MKRAITALAIAARVRRRGARVLPAISSAAPAPGAAAAGAAVRRSRHRSGTGSCWTSRPRPATSPPPSIPTYDLAICTRRSTTRSSPIDHSGPRYLPACTPAGASSRRPPTPPRTTRSSRSTRACAPRSTSSTRRCSRRFRRAGARPTGDPRRPARRGAAPRAARRRRLRAPRRSPFQPGTSAGDYQLTPPAFARPCSRTGRRSSRSCSRRANAVPAPAAAGADEPEVRRRDQRGQGPRRRAGLDPHARPDADRAVLEPADLGGVEPDRPDRRARPPRQPVAERAHLRGAQPHVRRRGDRLLRRQVRLPLLAPGDGDPRRRRATATPTRSPTRPGRRCRPPRPTPPTPAPTARSAPPARDVLAAIYGNDFALHRHLAGAARRRALVRELLRGGAGGEREPDLQRQPHAPGRGRR